jgi:hypothetical protein
MNRLLQAVDSGIITEFTYSKKEGKHDIVCRKHETHFSTRSEHVEVAAADIVTQVERWHAEVAEETQRRAEVEERVRKFALQEGAKIQLSLDLSELECHPPVDEAHATLSIGTFKTTRYFQTHDEPTIRAALMDEAASWFEAKAKEQTREI